MFDALRRKYKYGVISTGKQDTEQFSEEKTNELLTLASVKLGFYDASEPIRYIEKKNPIAEQRYHNEAKLRRPSSELSQTVTRRRSQLTRRLTTSSIIDLAETNKELSIQKGEGKASSKVLSDTYSEFKERFNLSKKEDKNRLVKAICLCIKVPLTIEEENRFLNIEGKSHLRPLFIQKAKEWDMLKLPHAQKKQLLVHLPQQLGA